MAPEKLTTCLPILTSEDLIKLAYDLRDKYRFNIDTRHFIDAHRAEDILLGLEFEGDLKGPERLKTILAPIFCSTSEEQTTFYNYFDSWLYENTRIKERFNEASGKVEHEHGDETSPGNYFTRHKYLLISLVSFVVLSVCGFWYFSSYKVVESKTWLQGRVVDSETKALIKEVSTGFDGQKTATDPDGIFRFKEFAEEATGVLTLSHQQYLEKKFSDTSTTTQQVTQEYQLWPRLDGPLTVVVEVKYADSGGLVEGATVDFLEKSGKKESRNTDSSGTSSFEYRQEDSIAKIEVTDNHGKHLKKNLEYQLHGYGEKTISVNLEEKLTPEEEALQALIKKINSINKEEQVDGFYKKYFYHIQIGSVVLPFLILSGWMVGRWYRKPLILERGAVSGVPSVDYVIVEWLGAFLFRNPKFRRTIQQFRQHRESSDLELDAESTINRTVSNGGMFTPAYRSRFTLPEYLVLIDRASFSDQQAKFVDEMINRLTGDGVFVDRYYFKRDPRVCQPEKPSKPQVGLRDLITMHPNHRLLIFSDGDGLINPLTGKPHLWIDDLLSWPDTGVFIPERTEGVRYIAMLLGDYGFRVGPASASGLTRHIESLQLTVESARFDWGLGASYPRVFEDKKDIWLQHAEPEQVHIDELIAELRRYLDDDGIHWLSACAVYPELHWELTLYLATRLKLEDRDGFTEEEQDLLQRKLLELTGLPWFRYGSMPDWLRLRLIALLGKKHQHHKIRAILNELLSSARKGLQAGAIKLPVARKSVILHFNHFKNKISALFRKEQDDSPLNDYVFSNYMGGSRRSLLAVIIPDRVKYIFFRKGQAIFGLKPIVSVTLAMVISAMAYFVYSWNPPRPEFVNPIPEFDFVKSISIDGFELSAGVSQSSTNDCLNRFARYRGIPAATSKLVVYHKFTAWFKETLSKKEDIDTSQFKFYYKASSDPDSGAVNLSDRIYLIGTGKGYRDTEGFYTESGLDNLLSLTGELVKDENVIERLLLLKTNSQHTWLITTNKRLFCLLDDTETRNKESVVQWKVELESFDLEKVRAFRSSSGNDVVDLGRRAPWIYSKHLYSDTSELENEIRRLVSDALGLRNGGKYTPSNEITIKEFVKISDGEFLMGSDEGDADEKPPHKVTIKNAFYMQKTEVTQGQWRTVMDSNPSRFKQGDNYPVENVSWDDVQEFIAKLNKESGENYRLPTEAEWEYAARSEGKSEKYSGFSNDDDLYLYANFCDSNCEYEDWKDDKQNDGYKNTSPVGSFKPNGIGLYDMSGNVWEWCQDWHDSEYYKDSPINDPTGPGTGSYRVFRGGGWSYGAGYCRSSYRFGNGPSYGSYDLGFRLVLPQAISEVQPEAKTELSPKAKRDDKLKEQSGGGAAQEQESKYQPSDEIEIPINEFVEVSAGEFLMGSDEGDADEKPPHKVTIKNAFYMQKTEVTQGQWEAVMGSNPSRFKKGDNYPVESVSWDDVQEFVTKLNKQTGKNYRLPTEAEWEYAARAGTTMKWYCGDEEGCLESIAWYNSNSEGKTHPVGTKQPNDWGLYDMGGNVWEWCQDWYDSGYYENSPVNDPTGPETGSGRVIRGGGWSGSARYCRSSNRDDYDPSYDYALGFRLVLPQAISSKQQDAEPKRSPDVTRDEEQEVRSGDTNFTDTQMEEVEAQDTEPPSPPTGLTVQ